MGSFHKIAIYGKGGIGKSVVATSLSARMAQKGLRVLHVGCDPKADSAVRLMDGVKKVQTVLDILGDDASSVSTASVINQGRLGIHCCESGGPPPGLGCGGRGVARTLEFLEDTGVMDSGHYDVAVFDVLGDVVCGGFAAPLRRGFGDRVFIVVSEEPMALYAANNICRAVLAYSRNGVVLGGLIANLRENNEGNTALITAFAQQVNTRVLGVIPRDPNIMLAERKRKTVVEFAPESPAALAFATLADAILSVDSTETPPPKPMDDDAFYAFLENS
jgi:nitrogenase iron protein NifH